ncbi:hypothetical protein MRX96_043716 [Rhipicephalus microplus]
MDGALLLHRCQRSARFRLDATDGRGDHEWDVVVGWDSRPAGVLHVWHNCQKFTRLLPPGLVREMVVFPASASVGPTWEVWGSLQYSRTALRWSASKAPSWQALNEATAAV